MGKDEEVSDVDFTKGRWEELFDRLTADAMGKFGRESLKEIWWNKIERGYRCGKVFAYWNFGVLEFVGLRKGFYVSD